MKLFLSLMLTGCALAQMEMPSIGIMRDASGAWHGVYGVGGNLLLGPEVGEPVQIELNAALGHYGGTLYPTETELVLRRPDATEVRFPVQGVQRLRAMSLDYVQVSAEGREYALRLKLNREALFLLPGVAQ